jgi:hypothetical protein
MKRLIESLTVVSISLVGALTGCSQEIEWKSARVSLVDSVRKMPAETVNSVVICDKGLLRQLTGYMPGVGKGKESPVSGHWVADVEITLTKEDGTSTTIFSNYDRWTERHGEWPTKPGFKAFIQSLFPVLPAPRA